MNKLYHKYCVFSTEYKTSHFLKFCEAGKHFLYADAVEVNANLVIAAAVSDFTNRPVAKLDMMDTVANPVGQCCCFLYLIDIQILQIFAESAPCLLALLRTLVIRAVPPAADPSSGEFPFWVRCCRFAFVWSRSSGISRINRDTRLY